MLPWAEWRRRALRALRQCDTERRGKTLSLTVVLPDGRVIRTARRARKSSAGYDLTRLFVGSEGTLGVFTEVTVRLQSMPAAISAAMCSFPSVEDVVNTAMQTIQAGVPVFRWRAWSWQTQFAWRQSFGFKARLADRTGALDGVPRDGERRCGAG